MPRPSFPLPLITHRGTVFPAACLHETNPPFSIHVPSRSCGFCHARAETIAEEDEEARGAARGESFGTDFTNKCRRLNPGMLQDGSLPLNRRLPAASYLPIAVPAYIALSSLFLPRFVLRGGASDSANGSLQSSPRQFATCRRSCDRLSFPLLSFSLVTRIPNLTARPRRLAES